MQQQEPAAPTDVVRYTVQDRVAVLRIDNPPVNASSMAVRTGLMHGIQKVAADPRITALVLIGTKNFISGSDLNEFSIPQLPEPELPMVIRALEELDRPVVAALSGATLGGGLELALGCDYRIALAGSVIGLPETSLGMIPGAGGTQRILRLLGPAATMSFVCEAKRHQLTLDQGHKLVDRVVAKDLLAEAVRFAQTVTTKRVLIKHPVPSWEPGAVEQAAATAISAGQGRGQIISAVGAIIAGTVLNAPAALAHERAEFTRLRHGPEAAALRHQFFAQKTLAKAHRPAADIELQRVSIVGAGTMGMGIARAFAAAGVQVTVFDTNERAARSALERVQGDLQREITKGRLSAAQAAMIRENLLVVSDCDQLAGSQLFIEAVFEDPAVKAEVLAHMESIAGSAVLATNTSYLDINRLGQALQRPENLVGMHFFSPAFRTSVVEIICADATGQSARDLVFAAAKLLGKVAVPAKVGDGFIGNRIFNAYRRQCELMLEEGVLPYQVDRALTDFGFAMGPFAVADMSGLDIAWRMRRSKDGSRDPRERYPSVADQLCEAGNFGQKTGSGWYGYAPGSRRGERHTGVEELIINTSALKGIERRSFTDGQIVRRVLLAMANEASLVLAEGVAERASDIDVMLVLGYGFPAYRGGISFWAANQSREQLEREMTELAETTGYGFTPGDLELLIS
ncbi:3-hydroxyacyl-CoA dehydrogenase NAD-binding domain-containing protein [Glutamicibacter uratoxydans]|uniref:3-hydroxyacyl-CoA dehydrogenase NAD-binding domain-containing protein n=1 Tax=Glutamicibacter uratoxydans TaxID=43667 RepID=UPI003D6EF4D6